MVVSKKVVVLLISAVALLVCLATMVGGTFATDATTYINANGLQFDLVHLKGDTPTILQNGGTAALFGSNWEPGRMETVRLKVENKGSIPFDFWIYPHAEAVDANAVDLASVIDVYVYDGDYASSERPNLSSGDWTSLGSLREISNKAANWKSSESTGTNDQVAFGSVSGTSSDGASQTITLLLHMRESADNNYQNKSINVKLTLYANQKTSA